MYPPASLQQEVALPTTDNADVIADAVDEASSRSGMPASSSVSDLTSMRSSCDSSNCLHCHGPGCADQQAQDALYRSSFHKSRSAVDFSLHRRRSSLGKRPPSSLHLSAKFNLLGVDGSPAPPPIPEHRPRQPPRAFRNGNSLGGMRKSLSSGDLPSCDTPSDNDDVIASTLCYTMDEDMEDEMEDDVRKGRRRFTSMWMRDCDRARTAQTWGRALEHEVAGTTEPVRAAFSDVWSFSGPASNEASARATTKFVVGNISVSHDGSLLAAATRAKQVHIYNVEEALHDEKQVGSSAPYKSHKMPARVSATEWVPGSTSLLTMGDHDGVLWQMDIHTGHILHEIDEHNGDKVWSVSHSHLHPGVVASASGMGCVNIWDVSTGKEQSMCKIMAPKKMPVCSLDFSKYSPNMLAMASADKNVYVYDMRNASTPCLVLPGHSRTVSSVSFQSASRLVSSSVDGTVALWDGLQTGHPYILRSFCSHKNDKNFVGLSTNSSNLIACGCETGSAHVYFPSWDKPVASTLPCSDGFVTSVAWIPTDKLGLPPAKMPSILAVADTTGSLKLHALIRWPGFQHNRAASCDLDL